MSAMLSEREFRRKAFHLLFGTLILLLIYYTGITTSFIFVGICTILGIMLSFAIVHGYKIPFFKKMAEESERIEERKFPGKAAVYFFVSALIIMFIFRDNPTLVLAAISVQVYADTAAALIGIKYGEHKLFRRKTWEGSIACLIVAAICINLFYPLQIALIAAIAATIIELLPMDDNMWVPLISAVTIRLLL
jgi:dolichol kinase